MNAGLREWLLDGIDLLTDRLPITIITKREMAERERNAFELGRDCGPRPGAPRRARQPSGRPNHLSAVGDG